MNCFKPKDVDLSDQSDDSSKTEKITSKQPLKIDPKNLVEVPSPSQIGKIRPKKSSRYPKLPSKRIVNIVFFCYTSHHRTKTKLFFCYFDSLS